MLRHTCTRTSYLLYWHKIIFSQKITLKNWLRRPIHDSRSPLPISHHLPLDQNYPLNWQALPPIESLISICSLMWIKIRQCSRDGATLENKTALADFFISSYGRNKVRFTHPQEIETSTASRIHPKAASAQTRFADLPPSTTSPWLQI